MVFAHCASVKVSTITLIVLPSPSVTTASVGSSCVGLGTANTAAEVANTMVRAQVTATKTPILFLVLSFFIFSPAFYIEYFN